ncbi:aminopeptidase N [Piscinibacter sakaiensis]|uniref:aminopeptidase N n=1 Tax=Piscinibacter sakaiensis TaxID=1547922 RepID=UPI00372BFAD8
MREGLSAAVRREDYVAPAYWVRTVELGFDLDPAKTRVVNRMQLERNDALPPQPLRLDGEDLDVTRVLVNGDSVSFRHEAGQLVIDSVQNLPAGPFTLEIRNTCAPERNTQLSGLYTSGGGFFTQCEAQGFRRITYFPDRPDVMAVYTVTLRADRVRYPVLLSNGNLVEQAELPDGRHLATWHDPFPKPSYLFALVAADLVAREQRIRSRSGRDHLLQVYVRRGDLDKTEHAMASLIASVVWDEARFGLPLDLERFMIVAVGDFNMGAMENKGLNIFNTKYVLASPATATDEDFAGIESVVGHEYFHNWTGNRITCRDWFQLSLKEGLTVFRDQEFSMDMVGPAEGPGAAAAATARAVKRIDDVRALRQVQFPEDAGSMAHPVRPDEYVEINNFYTPTVYEKGAEVVRMMQTLVGRDGFARGMTLYFERHDGQAVTCDDFAQAIADANPGSALAVRLEAFKRWYAQAGTPRLQARGAWDAAAGRYTLTLLRLAGEDAGAPAPLERLVVLDARETTLVFEGLDAAPVPSLLRGFSAPVLLDDGLDDAGLLTLLRHDADPFNRWEAGQRMALARLLAAVRAEGPVALTLDEAYVDAMRALLDDASADPAFKDRVLAVPASAVVAAHLSPVDPVRIDEARQQMNRQLARRLHEAWLRAWDANRVDGPYRPDPVSAGRRALAGRALAMLCLDAQATGDTVWPGRAYQRVKDADNMTEGLAALRALVDSHAELAEPALARFHQRHAHEALVIDKWFMLQALAPERDGRVFARAKALLKHPDFSLRNPNRARSLIEALCSGNPGAFHRADAAGCVFWADRVLELDAANPQLAARMARVMDRWRQLAEPYRSAAREAVARVAAKPDLSDDVREIVTRALEDA